MSQSSASNTTPITSEYICCKCKHTWPTSTHDVADTDAHIDNIEKFFEGVQVSYDMRQRSNSNYNNVHVLLLSFEDDDLGVMREILPLKHVFTELYLYKVEEPWNIPSTKSSLRLMQRVTSFIDKYEHPENLLIVYYAGHGSTNRDQMSAAPIWAARTEPSAQVNSSGIQEQLEATLSDVLLLTDSCHSAHPSASQELGHGVTEVIAACGFENVAPGVGPHSFTSALTEELARASEERTPIQVTQLYDRILRNIKTWRPSMLRDSNQNIYLDESRRPKYEKFSRRTPVHGFLTNDKALPRIIMLAPLVPRSISMGLRSQKGLESTTFEDSEAAQDPLHTMVLMAISITGDPLVHDEWTYWLRSAPSTARNIKLEAIYKSFSTIALVRMPVTEWSLLKSDPAYSFIGFTTSENTLPAIQSRMNRKNSKDHNAVTDSNQPSNFLSISTRGKYIKSYSKPEVGGSTQPSTSPVLKRNKEILEEPGSKRPRIQNSTESNLQKPPILEPPAASPQPWSRWWPGFQMMVEVWHCCRCGRGSMLCATTPNCIYCHNHEKCSKCREGREMTK